MIFVDNSQGEKLIQPSAVAFFLTLELFTTLLLRPYGHPGACGTTIDQSDADFTFCTDTVSSWGSLCQVIVLVDCFWFDLIGSLCRDGTQLCNM